MPLVIKISIGLMILFFTANAFTQTDSVITKVISVPDSLRTYKDSLQIYKDETRRHQSFAAAWIRVFDKKRNTDTTNIIFVDSLRKKP